MRADSPKVARADRKQFSGNHRFYLLSRLREQRTEVYKAGSARDPLWSTPVYVSLPFLSDDGRCIASVYEGGNLLDHDAKADDALITFYRSSGQQHVVKIGDVVRDMHLLRKTTSGFAWGYAAGFQGSGFALVLDSGQTLTLPACTAGS